MKSMHAEVPTYNGSLYPDEIQARTVEEYGSPTVPITAYTQAGLRIVLGTHNPETDADKPDLLIEHQPHAWAIILHPDGSDPSAYIYILDDGRTFIVPDNLPNRDPTVHVVDDIHDVPGLHGPLATDQYIHCPLGYRPRSSRLLPRNLRDLGIIGNSIRDALREIHRMTAHENIDPPAMERIVTKHLARLSRPTDL